MAAGDTVNYLEAGILGIKGIGAKTYFVCYGVAQTKEGISLRLGSAPAAPWQWNAASDLATLSFTYPNADSGADYDVPLAGGKTPALLAMNTTQSDHTFSTGVSEFPPQGGNAVIFSHAGRSVVSQPAVTGISAIPLSSALTWSQANAEAGENFDDSDSTWQISTQPVSMHAYGFSNGYGLFWNGRVSGTTVQANAGRNETGIMGIPLNWDAFVSRTWTSGATPDNAPRCWKATFNYAPVAGTRRTCRLTGTAFSYGMA